MRITLNIHDDALSVIRKYAEQRTISLGQAASDLVLRGAKSVTPFRTKNGWTLFDLSPSTPPLTSETLEEGEKAEHEEVLLNLLDKPPAPNARLRAAIAALPKPRKRKIARLRK